MNFLHIIANQKRNVQKGQQPGEDGIPCVICSDDPMILGNPGLAYDFWDIYLAGLLGLKEIKKLILNSYLYSGMTEDEKQLKINVWSLKWDRFVSGAAQTTPDDV